MTAAGGLEHGAECGCQRCRGFESGNGAAVTHGAYQAPTALSRDPEVAAWFEWIQETQPIADPCDVAAMWRLALVYRRLELSAAALEHADAAASNPLAAYATGTGREWLANLRADHDRWHARAARIEATLGRTPEARLKLGVDVERLRQLRSGAFDPARLSAERRALLAELVEEARVA